LHTWGEEKYARNSGRDTEGKRPLRGPRRRVEDYIKADSKEIGRDDVDWIHQIYERDKRGGGGCCECGNENLSSLKDDSILTSGGIRSCSMETFSGYVTAVFKAVLTT